MQTYVVTLERNGVAQRILVSANDFDAAKREAIEPRTAGWTAIDAQHWRGPIPPLNNKDRR